MIKVKNKKVILGMSGGVDSSVSLFLLKEQGFDVEGVSLNLNLSKRAQKTAGEVCKKYDVPHYVVDASKDFQKKVVGYFLKTLKDNKTPSPCLFCNQLVKIPALLEFAKKRKADYIATGHYAKVIKKEREYELICPKDTNKDQTYFLAFLSQKQISKMIFPLSNLTKKEVYQIAKKQNIKHLLEQSQDLCFVEEKSLPDFLERNIKNKPGKIYNTKGVLLGEHKGLHFFTRGQRKGINLPGGPFWVVDFDKKKNSLIVSNNKNEKSFFSKELELSGVNFISSNPPDKKTKILVRTRFRQPLVKANLSIKNDRAKLVFDTPQRSVTPGQIAVFYALPKGEICLGGGIIELIK
ncbi:MAG: tRNA 2-thiouridine(34) synthase MnmA [Candidatus Parcubacteria bacterium]|nr:tRNA 2-thiouridine(34) synthase MnmA [Candidatus Parcubacteria bacterium]